MNNNLSHIALILDGNKRWAKKNSFTNIVAYTKGFENISNLVKYSLTLNLKNLTIFTLSSENFKRSSINIIYKIIYDNFSRICEELVNEKGVKIKIFGNRDSLPSKLKEIFEKFESLSSHNNRLNLNIAFNYGFKNEIKNIIKKIKENDLKFKYENKLEIDKLFYLGTIPDPEILIRTGGHKRLSNFIMYNLTYTELFFTETLWPDFSEKEYKSIINEFHKIQRKYGL